MADNARFSGDETYMRVGAEGKGTLTVGKNVAMDFRGKRLDLYNASNLDIGSDEGGQGLVTLAQGASLIVGGGGVNVGSSGSGEMIVDGADLTIYGGMLHVGFFNTSEGNLVIDNGGSVKTVRNAFQPPNSNPGLDAIQHSIWIGDGGNGQVTVKQGGLLQGESDLYMGIVSNAKGVLTVNGGDVLIKGYTIFGFGESTLTVTGGGSYATKGFKYINSEVDDPKVSISFNGANIKAVSNNNDFITNDFILDIGNQGLGIDSNGFDVGTASDARFKGAADTTLTKTGEGDLMVNSQNTDFKGQLVADKGTTTLAQNNAFNDAKGVTINAQGTIHIKDTNQTLNGLQGQAGGNLIAGTGTLNLNNASGNSTHFGGTLKSTGTVNKTGAGKLTLGNSAQVGQLGVNGGRLEVAEGKNVKITNNLNVGTGATLGLTAGESPIIHADTAHFENASTIDINGLDENEDGKVYTIITTDNGVTNGGFNVTINGQALSGVVTLNDIISGSAYIDGKNVMAKMGLVWNNTQANTAHGTFNVAAGKEFVVLSALKDNISTNPQVGGWNGKDLTKIGAGTLILQGVNTYTGTTKVQEGALNLSVDNAVATSSGVNLAQNTVLNTAATNQIITTLTGHASATVKTQGGILDIANGSGFAGKVEVDQGVLVLAKNDTFNNTASVTLINDASINIGTTNQTLNNLTGTDGSLLTGTSGNLTLKYGVDTNFAGQINLGSGTFNKEGGGALTLAQGGKAGHVNLTEGTLNIAQNKSFTVDDIFNVGSNTTLGLSIGTQPAIVANSASFGVGSVINITSMDGVNQGQEYTLVKTNNAIGGTYDVKVNGVALSSGITENVFMTGNVFNQGNDVVAKMNLVWKNVAANTAHGTFNIATGESFAIGALTDNAAVTGGVAGFNGWNGTTLTKKGDGTLTLNSANTYTGKTDVQAGELILAVNDSINTSGELSIASGAIVNTGTTTQAVNTLTGAGIVKAQGGSLGVSNGAGFTGALAVEQGSLALTTDNMVNGATIDLSNNATLNTQATIQTFAALSGDANTTIKAHGGSLGVMNGVGFTGRLAVEQGTLALTTNNAFTNAANVNLSNNGSLNIQATTQKLNNLSAAQGSIVNTGTGNLTLDYVADATLEGQIAGAGTLNKTGAGALSLVQDGAVGALNLNAGHLNIAADKTLVVAGHANIQSGTTLGVVASSATGLKAGTVELGHNSTVNIDGFNSNSSDHVLITTTSGITNNGVKITVDGVELGANVTEDVYITGNSTVVGNDLVASMSLVWENPDLTKAHGNFNITNDFTLDAALSDNMAANGVSVFGWDGTTLIKKGAGTLTLNGINTYTGVTTVDAGKLIVGGDASKNAATVTGDINVNAGATLGGHGTVAGAVTLGNGATVAPGNSIGILTVNSIFFAPGAIYAVNAEEGGRADQLNVLGNVALTDGVVSVVAGNGHWTQNMSYDILKAGSITGEFGAVNTNLAFLDPTLSYSADSVTLALTRNSVNIGDVGLTRNGQSVGASINNLDPSHPVYQAIIGLDALTASRAFDNLSGEIHASTRSALLNNSRYTRTAVNQHLIGMQGLGIQQKTPEAQKGLWISTWGHDGTLKSTNSAAKTDNKGFGFLMGSDVYSNENTILGLAGGYEHSKIEVGSDRSSNNKVDSFHLVGYGATQAGPIDIRGGIGYSILRNDVTRNIWVSGVSGENKAKYNGSQIQLFVEGSHTLTLNEQANVTPYAGIAYTRVKTNDFSEKGGLATLHGDSKSDDVTSTSIGVRGQFNFGSNKQHGVYGDLGWQHNFGNNTPKSHMSFVGGTPYEVRGTQVGRDNALIGVGANFELATNLNLGVGYEGAWGSKVKDHGAKINLNWDF